MHSMMVDGVLASVVVRLLTESSWDVWKNENGSHINTMSKVSCFCRLRLLRNAKLRDAPRCGQAVVLKLDRGICGKQGPYGWISVELVLEFDFEPLRTESLPLQTLRYELTFWRRLSIFLRLHSRFADTVPIGGLMRLQKRVLFLLSWASYLGCCCLTVPYVALERSPFLRSGGKMSVLRSFLLSIMHLKWIAAFVVYIR